MRIGRLDLLRYGRHEGLALLLPPAPCDFHLIVGPNEAGKSTIRAAITDLLYGVPERSAQAYLHKSATRLAGELHQGGRTLAIERRKGRRQTLFDAAGANLPEERLQAFLGPTDRLFFEQMFGLDHQALVRGGDQILSASGEAGQVLFESAAGIASLGETRAALQAEADALWAPKASTRRFFVHKREYDQAGIRLQEATIRVSAWQAAASRSAMAAQRLASAQSARQQGLARRQLLERVRRVRPALFALEQAEQALAALPVCPVLPPDAAAQLEAVEKTRARTQVTLELLDRTLAAMRAELANLVVDDKLLAQAASLDELAEQARQCRDDPDAIATAEQQLQALRVKAAVMGEQLGWGTQVDDFGSRLPSAAVRGIIARLADAYPVLQARREALQGQRAARAAELADLERRLQALPVPAPEDGLLAVLGQAQRLGDTESRRTQSQAAVTAAGRRLSQAFDALGHWRLDEQALRRVSLPGAEHLASLLQRREARVFDCEALTAQLRKLDESLARERAQVAQFESREQPVGRDQVLAARQSRDEHWQRIRTAPGRLVALAPVFESALARADSLADQRHDTIRQEADLRSLREGLAMREAERLSLTEQLAGAVRLLEEGDAEWSALAGAAGLARLPLALAPGWQQARARVLELSEEAAEAASLLQGLEQQERSLADALARALGPATATGGQRLASLVSIAERHLNAHREQAVRRVELQEATERARSALAPLQAQALQADAEVEQWQREWRAAMESVGLGGDCTLPRALEWVEHVGVLESTLADITQVRDEQITVRRRRLQAHREAVLDVGRRLAPDLAEPTQILERVLDRLAAARQANRDATRLRAALAEQEAAWLAAQTERDEALALLGPLVQIARVENRQALAEAVMRSDARREALAAVAAARERLAMEGEGLSLAQLAAEAAPLAGLDLQAEVGRIDEADGLIAGEIEAASAEQAQSGAALAAISGSADAAMAESERRQSLAAMTQIIERYVRVRCAERLLDWSIEQYRESNQGPLLQRAGELFASLTLGSFARLQVESDGKKLALKGVRPDGREVDISGFSEGTRDQLYLALRLAALELHLRRSHTLPFVADDLFVNFDDRRAEAGLQALRDLSGQAQVIFLTHHEHLTELVRQVIGPDVNILRLA